MIKELKYLFFILTIALFIFFTGKYYFSNDNKKNSYRSLNELDKKNNIFSYETPLLENDTNNIITFVKKNNDKNKKNYNFWKLINVN
jgi:hypothetical protein